MGRLTSDSAWERERLSRRRLLANDAAGGWAELRRAFSLDDDLHGGYAEGDEGVLASKSRPIAPLLDALASAKTGWALAWRGALKRRVLDYAGAARDLARARVLGQRGADILTWLGEAKLQLGRAEEGRRDLLRAARLSDAKAWNHAWLGRAYLTLAKDGRGAPHLDRAIRLAPRNPLYYAWRGIARLREDRPAALSDFNRALALGRSQDRRWLRGWRALALPSAKALPELSRAARELPGYAPVAFGLARALRAAGRLNAWADALEAACRIDTKFIEGLPKLARQELEDLDRDLSRARGPAGRRWLARVKTALAEPAQGLALLDACLEREESALARLWRGEALCALGRPREALSDLSRAARDRAWEALARPGKAKALLALGRLEEALRELEAAAALRPPRAAVLAELGALRLLSGDKRGAQDALARAVARDPRQVDALVDLAVARGRPRDARSARALDPARARLRLETWQRLFKDRGRK